MRGSPVPRSRNDTRCGSMRLLLARFSRIDVMVIVIGGSRR
jgi:hypothetical protein